MFEVFQESFLDVTKSEQAVMMSEESGTHRPSPSFPVICGILLGIVFLSWVAWRKVLTYEFVCDDTFVIADNETIRSWFEPPWIFYPPGEGGTLHGRPFLNAAFGLDFVFFRLTPGGYRLTNIAIHLFNAFVLFAVIAKTLSTQSMQGPAFRSTWSSHRLLVAYAVAMCWAFHPYASGVTTYIAQRAESLGVMLILVSLLANHYRNYAITKARRIAATTVIVLAVYVGTGTKEITAIIPILIVLQDYAYHRDGIPGGRKRFLFYGILCMSWAIIAVQILLTEFRSGLVGYDRMGPIDYLVAQGEFLCRYTRSVFWPPGMVFGYGMDLPPVTWVSYLYVALVGIVFVTSLLLLVKRPQLGFPLFVAFLVLGPTSSVLPVHHQVGVEHRFYLPAAVVIGVVVCFVFSFIFNKAFKERNVVLCVFFVSVCLALMMSSRNAVFANSRTLWEDTYTKWPLNLRAAEELAASARKDGDKNRIVQIFDGYIAAGGRRVEGYTASGRTLFLGGWIDEAEAQFQKALAVDSTDPGVLNNLSLVERQRGHLKESMVLLDQAITIDPSVPNFWCNRAELHRLLGEPEKAEQDFRTGLSKPGLYVEGNFGLGSLYFDQQRWDRAALQYRIVVDHRAANHQARYLLALSEFLSGNRREASRQLGLAIEVSPQPSYIELRNRIR